MKHICTFESFLNESWPFDKKHITNKEENELAKYASKNDILTNYDDASPGKVKDKKFQSNDEEIAWELFEIWVSQGRENDMIVFSSLYTWTPHDDIYDKGKRRKVLADITNTLVDMMKKRTQQDLSILKKMGFYTG